MVGLDASEGGPQGRALPYLLCARVIPVRVAGEMVWSDLRQQLYLADRAQLARLFPAAPVLVLDASMHTPSLPRDLAPLWEWAASHRLPGAPLPMSACLQQTAEVEGAVHPLPLLACGLKLGLRFAQRWMHKHDQVTRHGPTTHTCAQVPWRAHTHRHTYATHMRAHTRVRTHMMRMI